MHVLTSPQQHLAPALPLPAPQNCTSCFAAGELPGPGGRPTLDQFRSKLPWFLASLPSQACAKGGAGAYTDSIQVGDEGLAFSCCPPRFGPMCAPEAGSWPAPPRVHAMPEFLEIRRLLQLRRAEPPPAAGGPPPRRPQRGNLLRQIADQPRR